MNKKEQIRHSFINLPVTSTPRWIIMVLDLLVSFIALLLAYSVRFDVYADIDVLKKEWEVLRFSLPFVIGIKLFVFYLFRIHKGLIRHTSFEDVKRIFFAVLTCSILLLIGGFLRAELYDGRYLLPTSVLLIEFLTSLLLLIGFRFAIKVYYYELNKPTLKSTKNILIYGAGVSGLITKRTIEKDPLIGVKIVGFIDDNSKLEGNRLEGIRIYNTSNIKKLITKFNINELIIAIQNPNKKNTSRIVDICLHYNVEVQSVPSFKKWINGEFSFKQIRKLNIDDLLGRDPIDLDVAKIKSELKGKVILISGAAGSIGSGIVRQVAEYKPMKIILLDQAESALYDFQNELIASGVESCIEVVIGDVRNFHRMKKLFYHFKPSIVFHAAAYKHVPMMEDNPSEAAQTNVLGTKHLVDLSDEIGVDRFVMISTDKAVNPTNVMGASKRIAEIYAQSKNNSSSTKFITTRFGNVLGSNGSVIPLFKKQIEKGGPITVTDENVTRYFMTIPEACQLVLEAGSMGDGGEIFVFDMGESVKIIDLAKKMIRLSGLEVNKDIEIKITGLRPGEKLYEELLADNENTLPTHHPQIMKAKVRSEELNKIDEIEKLLSLFDEQENVQIVQQMKCIVPEFLSNNSVYQKLDK